MNDKTNEKIKELEEQIAKLRKPVFVKINGKDMKVIGRGKLGKGEVVYVKGKGNEFAPAVPVIIVEEW